MFLVEFAPKAQKQISKIEKASKLSIKNYI